MELNKKLKVTRENLATLNEGDKVHIWTKKGSQLVTRVLEVSDSDGDINVSNALNSDYFYVGTHNITHIKLLALAPPKKEIRLHGVNLEIRGDEIEINDETVSIDTLQAIGQTIGCLEIDENRSALDVACEISDSGVSFGSDTIVRGGCFSLSLEQAEEIIHWIWDNYDEE